MKHFYLLLILLILILSRPTLAQIAGTCTIGPGGNYPTFASAVTALSSQGINRAVTFNIISGTYIEQIEIPAIAGSNAANTITFQSQSGNAGDVIMSQSSTNASANFIIKFDG